LSATDLNLNVKKKGKAMAKKLLIVDDSPTELKLIMEVFSGPEYTVVTASDGEEGVEKAKSEKPDLIILDVVMPKMNGFQACRTIKSEASTQAIPVILLTSKNQKSDEFWGKKQGADVYLTKPFDQAELLKAVSGLLG
jgi:twitching motility two-component system response regulator PilH